MGKSGDSFRSLRVISPVLNFFLVMAFVGRPLLEHFKKHVWQSDSIPPVLLLALSLFFLVCVYVSVGATAYYFSRAMRNINFFTSTRSMWRPDLDPTLYPRCNVKSDRMRSLHSALGR